MQRIDFLLNSGRWAFDAEPRYTSALLLASAQPPSHDHRVEVAGVADSAVRFARQSAAEGLALSPEALGPLLEVPLLPSQAAADLLGKLRRGTPFALGAKRWRCFPVAEFHETNDRALWQSATSGRPLWKGESFDQYDPHGREARVCPADESALSKQLKPNPGAGSILARETSREDRVAAVRQELTRARLAFRDVTNRTNSRTVIAAMVPPNVFLTNKAPYLAFVGGSELDQTCCLAIMNSIVFDWQARRFVETNVNFFILEGLRLPELSGEQYSRLASSAARLSCTREEFSALAEATQVDVAELHPEEQAELRAEIDAVVAHAYGLAPDDLEAVFSDFTLDAVTHEYRDLVRRSFARAPKEASARQETASSSR